MEKVLITGVTGFVGSHLADYILTRKDSEYQVTGIKTYRSPMNNIPQLEGVIDLEICDLLDPHMTLKTIQKTLPEIIFHYAAHSFVPPSWEMPSLYTRDNPLMLQNILESVKSVKKDSRSYDPKIFVACTSEEYGLVISTNKQLKLLKDKDVKIYPPPLTREKDIVSETPINELNPLRPQSPYAVGKVAAEFMAIQNNVSFGLNTVIARSFNTEGPRRGEDFVISNFAKQIALIEKGKREPILYHGNLDAERDWTDVRDVVRAHFLLATEAECYGEPINVGSGTKRSVGEMFHRLISLTSENIETQIDEQRMRPSDAPVLQADIGKLQKLISWGTEIDFDKTLEDTLNYWRSRV